MPELKQLLSDVYRGWNQHHIPRLGAALAFYTVLSLAPLLIVAVAVAGAVFGREAAEGRLVWQIQGLVGQAGAETVQSLLKGTQKPGAGILPTIIGTVALLVGASSVVTELRDALNIIWSVPKRQTSGLASVVDMLREKGIACVAVLATGLLLLISISLNAALSALDARYHAWLPAGAAVVLQLVDILVGYCAFTLLFALVYKWLPDLNLEWSDVVPGALITALLFSAGRLLIGIYIGRASYASIYGAAGSLVAVLVWVYYSAQIFFLGAEFTRAWAQSHGRHLRGFVFRKKTRDEKSRPVSTPTHQL